MSVVPQRPGGWWHDYVCPTHGIELDARGGEDVPLFEGVPSHR